MAISDANDAMIRRLEKELQERNQAAQGLIANANEGGRDLNDAEKETLGGIQTRMGALKDQLEVLEASSKAATETGERLRQIDVAMTQHRNVGSTEVEYRSAGAWALDSYKASQGDRTAAERLEVFYRAHQKTTDNLGVVPDPIIGGVINFIDAARPIVSATGVAPLTAGSWHRPKVTVSTLVGVQGDAGAAADEKVELDSRAMTITRLPASAVTYGGYVNVSRQNIDFSDPQILDIIINDLAAQYAIQTERAAGIELGETGTAAVTYDPLEPDSIAAAIWDAVSQVYSATKGQGARVLAVAPDVLSVFGPLFAPVNPGPSQSPGFSAGMFGQGVMGTISGIPVVMSAGLDAGEAILYSTAAFEVYEQRVGALQVVEPSVLGVQVAYAGYFTALTIEEDGIVPLASDGGS